MDMHFVNDPFLLLLYCAAGVWVAHGEGRAYFPNHAHLEAALARDLAPLRYVDDRNDCTDRYPMNPNGSPQGIAALCSENGRHLAIMPHPERSFLKWQVFIFCSHGVSTHDQSLI
jgi:phosphoribosylformylglycinamidine synthase